jgi:hypothetical protein
LLETIADRTDEAGEKVLFALSRLISGKLDAVIKGIYLLSLGLFHQEEKSLLSVLWFKSWLCIRKKTTH